MSKSLQLSLVVFFLLQLVVASLFGLAHDEAYYWIYSRHLDWGYFDHPPMVALSIRMFSFLPHGEWSLRLGFILQQVGTIIVLMKLLPERSRAIAMALFFAFPLASVGGMLALPDMPLLFMTALYCLALRSYLEKDDTRSALALGCIIPLLLYSKYHGILVIFFTILALPKLLLRKSFYLITIIAILLFLPHVWWQYQHDFSTLRYHFLERPKSSFSLKRIFDYLSLQVILAGVLAGPVVWWSLVKHRSLDHFDRAMRFISVGIVVFFLISTISKKFEANWTILISVPLIYLSALSPLWEKKWARSLAYLSAALVLAARLALTLSPETVAIKRLKEFHGWKDWSQKVKLACGERKLVANSYQIASKLAYYLEQEVPALNYHSRKNQFDYWKFEEAIKDAAICYVTDKQEFSGTEVLSPEGKRLKLVIDHTVTSLWQLKEDEQRSPH